MLNPKPFCQAFFSLEVKPKLSTNLLGKIGESVRVKCDVRSLSKGDFDGMAKT
jgi:hypothetical protein